MSSMNRAYFSMGLHFHQPVGNFENILERAYQNCYKPFIDTLSGYPAIKMTLHFSGNLLDYFEDRHSDLLDKVGGLVRRGQIEIMGGGYYEPIFQAIPKNDVRGQIEMLSGYCERRFGIRPRGIWVPERVWSPDLIQDFNSCHIEYSVLDDTHLIKAGVRKDDLCGYFTTGPGDKELAIFPSDTVLRYSIPFKSGHETLNYFKKRVKKNRDMLFIYGDDGEKFGEWPWTYDWVYKRKWLENFFDAIVKAEPWLKTVTFSECLGLFPALRKVDIPEASYSEMLKWSGGSWMNYLSRYPESEQMHKRMLYISERIRDFEDRHPETREKIKAAKKELYKGQTNCPYWHGVFGGIYLYHLRKAVYEHLINADAVMRDIEHGAKENKTKIREFDFYKNGNAAVIVENNDFFVCIDPERGGSLRELDCRKTSANLINTLARRRESYHEKILDKLKNHIRQPMELHETIKIMDKRIKKDIFYDRYNRACLVDHFIERGLKMEDFENCNYADLGGFAEAPYAVNVKEQDVILSRTGKIGHNMMELAKEMDFSLTDKIKILYTIRNRGPAKADLSFGTEFNISMPYADSERYSYENGKESLGGLHKKGSASPSVSFSIKDSDNYQSLGLTFSEPPRKIWYFPVMTISQSERAYDLNYQSSCIFPIWDIGLDPGEDIALTLFLSCI